ncbi:DUF2809 domain-containing protein [Actinoplanes sp. NBRC 103695]|uniref:ribosomal maturation YjgA family protein n=1 Tax=Actinoplanes sp. NBRC 103695 TaxID=3032202 RepID=UPI0024A2BFD9|nr:DUF2809 domain-containing protein [Actinoplanes sp. NBRC 103695]GLY97736.1 hypothetical protein Acsp02_49900 [Actinoplanes sp. NBRC 103695]
MSLNQGSRTETYMTRWAILRRLSALGAVVGILAVAFGIREVAGPDGAVAQYSGTALYAAMIYAGWYVLAPSLRPPIAAGLAVGFCWLVEFFQLSGVPAALSERSILARLALGVTFDPTDLLWYALGVLPLLAVHGAWRSRMS